MYIDAEIPDEYYEQEESPEHENAFFDVDYQHEEPLENREGKFVAAKELHPEGIESANYYSYKENEERLRSCK